MKKSFQHQFSQVLLTTTLLMSSQFIYGSTELPRCVEAPTFQNVQDVHQNDKPIYILSIDGGGIRGLIPATLLKELNNELLSCIKSAYPDCPYPAEFYLHWIFNWLAGTSTGGLITLGLACPQFEENTAVESRPLREFRKPAHTVDKISRLYKDHATEIFPPEKKDRWLGLGSLFGTTYDPAPLEKLFDDYFGIWTFNDSLQNILIPTCSISQQRVVFLGSPSPQLPHFMRSGARYTSAAPTYVASAQGESLDGQQDDYVDGGVGNNNPALDVYLEARKRNPQSKIILLSLGTGETPPESLTRLGSQGKLAWAKPIGPLSRRMSSLLTHQRLLQLQDIDHNLTYMRVQPALSHTVKDMDDTQPDTLLSHETLARSLFSDSSEMIKARQTLQALVQQQGFYGYFPVIQDLRKQIDRVNATPQQQTFIDLSRRGLTLRGLWEVCHYIANNDDAKRALIRTISLDLSRNNLPLNDPHLKAILERFLGSLHKSIEFVNFTWNETGGQENIQELLAVMGVPEARYLPYTPFPGVSFSYEAFLQFDKDIVPQPWNCHILFELGAKFFGETNVEKRHLESLLKKSLGYHRGLKDYINYLVSPHLYKKLPDLTPLGRERYRTLVDVCKGSAEHDVYAAKILARIYGSFYKQAAINGINSEFAIHAHGWVVGNLDHQREALSAAQHYGALWERQSVYSKAPKEEREDAKRFLESL